MDLLHTLDLSIRFVGEKMELLPHKILKFEEFAVKLINVSKGKRKAVPLHAWTGPEVSRRLRLPNFKTIGT